MNAIERRTAYESAKSLIDKAKSILISGHLSPDGDSLGSMIALARMLCAAGKNAVATADIRALGKPGFLNGVEDLVPLRKLKKKKFDLFIYVDASSPDRLPPEVRPFAEKLMTLTIDHHATSNPSGVAILDPKASSAGELVWQFAKWMEWPIDSTAAEALWVALVTDTGRFAYDSVSPGTLRTATDLLKRGVRTALINDILYNSFSMKAMELKRRAWRSLHIWKNRKVAEVTLLREDFREVRGSKAEAEDIIEIPRSVAGNQIALFFYQIPDRTKEIRVSIRTRSAYDATALAKYFGGGGHVKAAGCTVKGSMASAKRQIRRAVKEILLKK
ncbi:MAG: bifunctional oligoribonuclease/PAP phosphatase NrnA [Kiritimatiellae bacterium]|nr:bifunctional oligoribonuclease/PAP phosphatase NrnA [Kiritimatiellia bacterium]